MPHLTKTDMKIVEEKNIVLEYDDDLKCIIQTWKGFFNSEVFRSGVERTNQLFAKKKPVATFLVDISQSSVIKKEDTDWAATTAIPIAIKNGLKNYGFVLPANVFTQVSLNNFKEQLNQPTLTIRLFDNMESAKEWARSLA